ncbi:MAG: amino acid adenylation domain-containing protein [Halanaerobiales bacterium]|nr:amino acid adenylation domain-containing protein [Halanaerobiales bacterium]
MDMKITIPELFYQIVDQMPDAVALEYGSKRITYKELDQKSNQVAHALLNRGYKKGAFIGIFVDNRTEVIVLILGILKAGCAFVPLDPGYPKQRVKCMVDTGDLELLITDYNHLQRALTDIKKQNLDVVLFDEWVKEFECLERPAQIYKPDDRIYIYFTSGSTGKPKGIVGCHKGLLQFIKWENETLDIQPGTRFSQIASIGFDAFLKDTLIPLCAGGTVCIPEHRDLLLNRINLTEWIDGNNVHVLSTVPSIFKLITSGNLEPELFQNLKYVVLAGEHILPNQLKKWYQIFDERIQIVNFYGPTETTLTKTCYFVSKKDLEKGFISAGKAIRGSQIIIFDEEMNPCSAGTIGEIFIRTPYRTLGYTDANLTRERFIQNPFTDDPKDLLYKTGDLGRVLFDGNLEVLGRKDFQVKIRGVRIELGDIENQLLDYKNIKEVVVLDQQSADGEKFLCAYIVTAGDVDVKELRRDLLQRLPEYMIPTFFIQLERIPLNPNGKVDRKALPVPSESQHNVREYVAPSNEVEEKIAQIWADVLGVDQVGREDHFFDLGGHSLKATTVISKIYQEFGVRISLKKIFELPTLKEYAGFVQLQEEKGYSSLEKLEEKDFYPVLAAQRRIYIIMNQFGEKNPTYNMPRFLQVDGMLDNERLEIAFQKLVQRHESLRTSFHFINGEVVQKIASGVDVAIKSVVVSEQELKTTLQNFIQPFDLEKAPLVRSSVVRTESRTVLAFDMHHIISDGTSMEILVDEFCELYAGNNLPDLRVQCKEYVVWQNDQLESNLVHEEKFWLEKFSEEIPFLNMPTDYSRSSASFIGDQFYFELTEEESEKLRQLGQQSGTTLYMNLLAIYSVFLAKYTKQEDIIIGTPIAGRNHPDTVGMIGMFVNTLSMRNYPKPNLKFKEYLLKVKENTLKAFENQNYPFELLVENLGLAVERDHSHNPLFDTMLAVQNLDFAEKKIPGLTFSVYPLENPSTKVDLNLHVREIDGKIQFKMIYRSQLFQKKTIERMGCHLQNITEQITLNPSVAIKDIELTTAQEKKELLFIFNQTDRSFSSGPIHQFFRQQVDQTPDCVAVVYENEKLTYRQLNERANQLARTLREKGVERNQIVGILLDRSIEIIVAILGILKSGGAFLPIDPEYPSDRIQYIFEDSQIHAILSKTGKMNDYTFDGEVISLDDPVYYSKSTDELPVVNSVDDLCYVIYTSGSTGLPKGVMVEHRALSNYTMHIIEKLNVHVEDRSLLLMSYSFDGTYTNLWPALLAGASVYIISDSAFKDSNLLIEYIYFNQITLIKVIPSLFKVMLNSTAFMNKGQMLSLRTIIFGGEEIRPNDLKIFKRKYPKVTIVNHYGPTEATIGCTSIVVDDKRYASFIKRPVIGKPHANMQLYVFDKYRKVQPVGVPGELYISGDGLARGYLNRSDLTAERFVDNPYNPGRKMYRTGDLARWTQDGEIEFLGRTDHQVKIRGYRIELGEIENHLVQLDFVKEAIVVVKKDIEDEKIICAYLVSSKKVSIKELRKQLENNLPHYMIPTQFAYIDQIPVRPSGKIDFARLSKVEAELDSGEKYVAPRNEIDEKLVTIWENLLDVKGIGIDDHFFELGGHSLKLMNMLAKIHKEFQVEIPLMIAFEAFTIRELAEKVKDAKKKEYYSIKRLERRDYYPVSSAQKRLFALHQFMQDDISYNIPRIVEIKSLLDSERIERTFQSLIERHESLRTSFTLVDGELVQVVHEQVNFKIQHQTVEEEKLEQLILKFIRPFDLSKAPLLRVGLLQTGEKTILIMDLHHIISDGVSTSIFMNEFLDLYENRSLPELNIQYRDFATWQNEFLQSEQIQEQENYWLDCFKGEIPVLSLPYDFQRPNFVASAGDVVTHVIDKELAVKLKELANEHGATLNMIMMAVYFVLLFRYSGQEDQVVGMPIAGRPHADLENIIGFFVNSLPIRNRPEGQKTFMQFLAEVSKNALAAYTNQDYQFEMLVERLKLNRDLSRNPLFDTMLTLRNTNLEHDASTDLKVEAYQTKWNAAKFDIECMVTETTEGLQTDWIYSTLLFRRETIERMASHLTQLIQNLVEDPTQKLANIQMLTDKERRDLIYGLNNRKMEIKKEESLYHLFELQAAVSPEKIALKHNDQEISFGDLNKRANQIAWLLRKSGVQKDSLIGILLDRSILMVACILGIWKANGAYIPTDTEYPIKRIRDIMSESDAHLLLTTDAYVTHEIEEEFGQQLFNMETVGVEKEDISNLNLKFDPDSLAYVIFTSGSTGKPKGAMVEHVGMKNHMLVKVNDLQITHESIIAQNASQCFDISVWQFFVALIKGGTTVIYSKEVAVNPPRFVELLIKDQITVLEVVPSFLSVMLDYLENKYYELETLRYLLVTGETVKPNLIQRWFDLYPCIKVVNAYGPTEASDDITHFIMDRAYLGESIPIGYPLDNFHIYIVDKYMNLCPIGVKGEICVSGIGVGRGYINNLEKTTQVFLDDPFVLETGVRLYKTGDLGRWLEDGIIEFFGRKDYQVKIRGFRIELGEIENSLVEHPQINEAVVLDCVDERESKYLCAYLVVKEDLSIKVIRKYLLQKVPEYMVPAHFVFLDQMPLNANGKVDRKSLLTMQVSLEIPREEYRAPETEVEIKIAEIWEKILGVEKVGIHDNFFELGGDSIKAIQIIGKAAPEGYNMTVKDIFNYQTIAELLNNVDLTKKLEISQDEVKGKVDLTPIQIEYFERKLKDVHYYNLSNLFTLRSDVDLVLLEKVFEKILEHHDALRMVYKMENGQIRQYNRGNDEIAFQLKIFDLSNDPVEIQKMKLVQISEEIQANCSLEEDLLLRLAVFDLGANGKRLLIHIHHLVVDGVSWRILLEDINNLYHSNLQNELPLKTSSYQDWSQKLRNFANTQSIDVRYWEEIESSKCQLLTEESIENYYLDQKSQVVTLDEEYTNSLLTEVNWAYNTGIDDILLSALVLALSEEFKIDQFLINLESHGREEIFDDVNLTRTIGWFTSLYPLYFERKDCLETMIIYIKENLRRVPNKGINFGIARYLQENEKLKQLIAQIEFNYLGQIDGVTGKDVESTLLGGSSDDKGRSTSPNNQSAILLSITGVVVNHQLSMSFNYSSTFFIEERMKELVSQFKSKLIDIIDHCLNQNKQTYTASDYGVENTLDEEDFGYITDLYS